MKRSVLGVAVAMMILPVVAACGASDGSSSASTPQAVGEAGGQTTTVVSNLPAPVQMGVPFVVRNSSGVEQARVTFVDVELDPQCPKTSANSSYARTSARGHFVSVEMDIETLAGYSSVTLASPSGYDFEVRDDSGYGDKSARTDEQYCFGYDQTIQQMAAGGRYRGMVLLDTKRGAKELIYRPSGLGGPGWSLMVDAFAGDAPPIQPLGKPANEFTAAPMYTPSFEPIPTVAPPPLTPAPASGQAKTVLYEIVSNGALSSVTWFDEDSDLQQSTSASAPWSKTVKNSSTYFIAGLGAQTDGTSVTCRITVDGRVVDTQTATGKYAVVNCTAPM